MADDAIVVAGYFCWCLDSANETLDATGLSEHAANRACKEFVCGGFSPSQQLLQVWGTHIDKAGRHTLGGRDIYKIHLSSQNLSAEGKSACIIKPLSPHDAWR